LFDGGADLIEGIFTPGRGLENALTRKGYDILDQLTSCCLIEPGQPIAKPENF
jgi:hypothetical protein